MKHKNYEEALSSLFLIESWEQAADLIEEVGHEYLKNQRSDILATWLNQLPQSIFWSRPRLICLKVWILPDVDKYSMGETLLQHAKKQLELHVEQTQDSQSQSRAKSILSEIYALMAVVARLRYDQKNTLKYSNMALELADYSTAPLRWRPYTTVGADHYFRGKLVSAEEFLRKGYRFAQLENEVSGAILAGSYLVEVYFQLGKLGLATKLCDEMEAWVDHLDVVDSYAKAFSRMSRVGLLLEQRETDLAFKLLMEFRENESELEGEPLYQLVVLIRLIQLHLIRKDYAAAQQVFQELELLNERIQFEWPFMLGHLELQKARIDWGLKKNAEVRDNLVLSIPKFLDTVSYVRNLDRIQMSVLAAATGLADAADELLVQVRDVLNPTLHPYLSAYLKVAEAIVADIKGQPDAAEDYLKSVIDSVIEEGFVNLIFDFEELVFPIANRLVAKYPKNNHVKKIKQWLPEYLEAAQVKLSKRELDVLTMVKHAKSDKEISHELNISLGTVKTHLRNIFRKLEVGKRGRAVLKAEELGLIEDGS